MNEDQFIQDVTDTIYMNLFGKTATQMRTELGLSMVDNIHDDNLRDHMGIQAINALAEVEGAFGSVFASAKGVREVQAAVIKLAIYAAQVGNRERAKCDKSGIDFLTGKRIV